MFEELQEVLVLRGGPKSFQHVFQAVLAQVADRGDLTIGVEMPRPLGAEVSAPLSRVQNSLRQFSTPRQTLF